MAKPPSRRVGPSFEWLREERERAEGKIPSAEQRGPQAARAPRSRSRSGGARGTKGGGRGNEDQSLDWHCDCGQRNFARRQECYKCGAPRGGSRSRSRGRADGKGGSKGGGKGGEDSRSLFQRQTAKQRRRSSSSSSSDSAAPAPASAARPARQRSGLWDSTCQVPEAKPSAAPAQKRKRTGLELEAGAKVDVHGLVGAQQYNGCEGVVLEGPNIKRRWKVQVMYQCESKELALLPENLQPKPSCGWELAIAGLSNMHEDCDVSQALAQFGHVQSCRVTRDRNGESKGVALAVLSTRAAAESAIAASDRLCIRGLPLTLQYSTMVKQEMGLLQNRDEAQGDVDASCARRTFQESSSATVSSAGAPSDMFAIGQRVRVTGLKAAPQHNGALAAVRGLRADGRFEVLLDGSEGKMLALKVDNLTCP